MANFSTQIILEKRRPRKKDGKFPVRLRVTINRQTRYYGLGAYLTEADYDKMFVSRPRQKYKKMLAEFVQEEKRANEILEAMETPSFDQFSRLFLQKGEGGGNVEKYYLSYIKECKDDDRLGTASSYECSIKSLTAMMGLDNINFRDITPRWLKAYERKMLDENKSISTVGVYLRPLRYLYNKAISDGVVQEKHYPFGSSRDGKYEIPTSENRKRPLNMDELQALAEYSGNDAWEKYRDFFLLSYYLMGLNFYDLLTLRWSQLDENRLKIVRQKTRQTSRSRQRPITIVVNAEAREIIERRGNRAGELIFDVVKANDSADVVRQKVQNFTRNTNQALQKLAEELDINKNISTVFARHSAASQGVKAGRTLAVISKTLGHSNLTVTSSYIDSLDDEETALSESLSLRRSNNSETSADEDKQDENSESE